MSHQATTWAYDQPVQPSAAKFVLVTLANYANADGYCYPSQKKLAEDTGQDERTVRRHLAALEAAKIIHREHRIGKHGHRASDGFYLVGFKPLPDNLSADQPDNMTARPPDRTPARKRRLADNLSIPTGQMEQFLPGILPGALKELNRQLEPSVEPIATDKPSRGDRPRDFLWDTLTEIHGFTPTDKTPEHGRWNKACSIWRALHAEPDDMRLAYRLYGTTYQGASVTALAVAGRAEQLLSEHRGGTRHMPNGGDDDYRDEWKAMGTNGYHRTN